MLCVVLVEKLRIGKTRPQHLLIPNGHGLQVHRIAIAHRDEGGQQPAIWGVDRKVTLMLFHHCHEHFGWQGEKAFLKATGEHRWVFDEIGHLVE